MKIIGIFGGSGTGKSTTSKMINKKLKNSIRINVDKYMHDEFDNQREEILDAIHIQGKEREKYICNHTVQSVEINKIAIGIMEEKVYTNVMKEISELKDEYDYAIIDWYALPFSRLYDVCHYTVCVYADYDKRLKRLITRLKDTNIYGYGDRSYWAYEKHAIEKRVEITALNDYGYKANFMIENNANIEELEEKVNQLVKKLI